MAVERSFRWHCLAFVAAAAMMSGCGGGASDAPKVYPVTGKVTKGGQPLADIQVNFVPVSDAALPSSGTTNAEGVYTLKRHTGDEGAMPGSYRVVLTGQSKPADMVAAYSSAPAEGKGAPSADNPNIPKEWMSKDTSPKTVEVKAEPNTFDIDVDAG